MNALTELLGQGALIGAHLLSAHSNPTYHTVVDQAGQPLDSHRFELVTPGAYVRLANGGTFGAFRNSYGRASVYAGYTWETADRRWALTLGGITGYNGAAVQPLVAPSMRWDLGQGWALRTTLTPKPPRQAAAATLHFSIEVAL